MPLWYFIRMIQANIVHIKDDIASICHRLKKNFDEVTFIGVTKYVNAGQVKEVVNAGVTDIGENRVGDAKEKFELLGNSVEITKHLIGHLQTNKVKEAVGLFDLIQSVDSLKVAKEIEKQAANINKVMDVLIEVNVSGEEQKYGFCPKDVMPAIEEIRSFKHVRVLGLMTMAPFVDDENIIRNCFRGLKSLFEEVKAGYSACSNIEMKYLSMGMTADYKIALEEGSNMVRIGRAIYV